MEILPISNCEQSCTTFTTAFTQFPWGSFFNIAIHIIVCTLYILCKYIWMNLASCAKMYLLGNIFYIVIAILIPYLPNIDVILQMIWVVHSMLAIVLITSLEAHKALWSNCFSFWNICGWCIISPSRSLVFLYFITSILFFNGTIMKWSSNVSTFGSNNCLLVQEFFYNSSPNGSKSLFTIEVHRWTIFALRNVSICIRYF